jgi:hypothetical protein
MARRRPVSASTLYTVGSDRANADASRWKGYQMRHLLLGAAMAVAVVNISPVQAQAPSPAAAPPQWPRAAYSSGAYQRYGVPALTPEDAYREGLINRWELEQLVGPLPQALRGPSVNGGRGGDGGDRGG